MANLVREIVNEDLSRVNDILFRLGRSGYKHIERLSGLTNHSYKVVTEDDEELMVRIPGEGTEKMINRLNERKSTELACKLQIDSELLWFGDDGTKVMRFIKNPQPMNEEIMKRTENIDQAADIFRKLHSCGEDTGVRFEVFEMAELYESIIDENQTEKYSDYEDTKRTVMDIKNTLENETGKSRRVPCHNDSLIGNWVLDEDGRLYLIDWEYSGMNDPMWDLSCLSIEAGYTNDDDNILMNRYYGRQASELEKRMFVASKLYVDYLWTLWGLTRVLYDGEFMQEYADARYERLKKNLTEYSNIGNTQ